LRVRVSRTRRLESCDSGRSFMCDISVTEILYRFRKLIEINYRSEVAGRVKSVIFQYLIRMWQSYVSAYQRQFFIYVSHEI
jgi:hypothetical protein